MARSWGSKKPAKKNALATVAMLVNGCTAERLAELRAESLAASYNVPVEKAAALLDGARKARAR